MQMENYLLKALAYNKQVRIIFTENTDLIKSVCHVKQRLLKTALGTTVSTASMLSGTLKGNQRISLKVKASHPAYKIFADVDSHGNIRGYLSDELRNVPSHELGNLSLQQLIGDRGCIQVVKDVGMNHNFTGITNMPYGNIVDDLSYYFGQSEQIPTCFANHIEFDDKDEIVFSRGILAQLLPGAQDGVMDHIREILNCHPLQNPAYAASEAFKELPAFLFDDIEIMSVEPIQFFCGCSKEMFYPMLHSLGQEELKNACEKKSSIHILCSICGKEYSFASDEIAGLIQEVF
jgi:molecular chaperone Hsp33